jgi:anti-sigma-K factor RskA
MTEDTPEGMNAGEADRDILAAEYLLGLLDPRETRAVAAQAERDPNLAAAIAAWGTRLEPLAALAEPVAPSDTLWARIARDLPPRTPANTAHPPPRAPSNRAWRGAAFIGFGLAACLGAALLVSGDRLDVHITWDAPARIATVAPPPSIPRPVQVAPPPRAVEPTPQATAPQAAPPAALSERAVALLTAAGADHPAMKVRVTPGGTISLLALQTVNLPPGKELGLWVWPHGVARPILIGRLPAEGGKLRFPLNAEDGTPMMVTLEPRGLPFTGEQGPTLFQGQVVVLN